MKRFLSIVFITVIVGLAVASAVIFFLLKMDGRNKYDTDLTGVEIPAYRSIELPFKQVYDPVRLPPIAAGAVIDINNDGFDELFLGGGTRQNDALLSFRGDHFVNFADPAGFVKQGDDATTGAITLDIDGNGLSDLLVTRESGVFLYTNTGDKFIVSELGIQFAAGDIPLGIAPADLNRDGYVDFFIPACRYRSTTTLKRLVAEREQGARSYLFLNNGDNSFTDVTEAAGILYDGAALQAMFADMDSDGLEDLIVLNSDGQLRLWQNLGNLLFTERKHVLSGQSTMFMGFAVGDYNNDGRLDILLTNSGSTLPGFAVEWVLGAPVKRLKWTLLHNMGLFSFVDRADEARLADYELARGSCFVDLNGDGREDIVAAQNHPAWPPHHQTLLRLPGRVLLQSSANQFAAMGEISGVSNQRFGSVPLVADVNGDGQPDIVFVNLAQVSQVFISSRGRNNFIQVRLPDTPESLGSVVRVKTVSGEILKKTYHVGGTMSSDSSHVLFFGLGQDKATDVMVDYPDGSHDEKSGELYNIVLSFKRDA